MASSNAEKIKSKINIDFVSKFDISKMQASTYIPICEVTGFVYVVVTSKTVQNDVRLQMNQAMGISSESIKFAKVDDNDFNEILDYVKSKIKPKSEKQDSPVVEINRTGAVESEQSNEVQLKYDTDETEDELISDMNSPMSSDDEDDFTESKYFSRKIGEVLIDMGLATDEQIMNALFTSKKEHIPLGTVLVRQSIITLDQLKMALKAQLGFDVVTEEQLNLTDDVLSILPEDFIRMYKVLPIRNDEEKGTLVVGMVNPNDKQAVNNIIGYTGMNPEILILTHFEFAMVLQKYFNENAKAIIKKNRTSGS